MKRYVMKRKSDGLYVGEGITLTTNLADAHVYCFAEEPSGGEDHEPVEVEVVLKCRCAKVANSKQIPVTKMARWDSDGCCDFQCEFLEKFGLYSSYKCTLGGEVVVIMDSEKEKEDVDDMPLRTEKCILMCGA